ncbi:UNVERIFIED_CONTAM: hypothetical protein Sradi_5218200 [Sesamum radiatum]|uniref:Reverse transcriptase zinc-binding domain-containing protein n=1 Tax=Sesamum radiatum TaxID=300843 RepID=A0AAW2LLJ7_SESRA
MLQDAEVQGQLTGVAVARLAPRVSHLLFADDTLAGKGVLIKTVIQSLPTYAMSCFQLPLGLLWSLESLMADFCWQNQGEKRVHWIAWRKLCQPVVNRGLGFHELKEFNLALLAKVRLLLKEGCRSIPKEGWRWQFECSGRFSVKSAYRHAVTMRDRELASTSTSGQLLSRGRGSLWSLIWHSGVLPKVKILIWRLCNEALPTLVKLARRAESVDTTCAVCGMGSESLKHLFWECPFSRQVCALSNIAWHMLSTWTDGPREWMLGVAQQVDRDERGWVFTLCWAIWRHRCQRLMEGRGQEPWWVWRNAMIMLDSYSTANRCQEPNN